MVILLIILLVIVVTIVHIGRNVASDFSDIDVFGAEDESSEDGE